MAFSDPISALGFVREQGVSHIALCYWDSLPAVAEELLRLPHHGVRALIQVHGRPPAGLSLANPVPILSPEEACSFEPLDAILVIDQDKFAWILRCIERVLERDLLVLPGNKEWVVPANLARLTPEQATLESVPAEYLVRSGLSGHYLEFGTYWGRWFFQAYYRFRHVLKGNFYAIDSFHGLSQPEEKETLFTAGDYRLHTYNYNIRSFVGLARLAGMPEDRLRLIPGYYGETLVGHSPSEYGLEQQSVSVCIIDCDLYEPTRQALDFVTPLLEPGALLYFDDWRLCRASPEVGERAAALAWLRDNPDIELVELHQTHWQNQWFIFNRRGR
ncbi:MAG: TylF/MycF/NovP-related O-methyltransferase [Candidatus Acidiferrales bacterium]